MYPRALFAIVTGLAFTLACESDPPKPTLPAANVPAGRVVELVGVAHIIGVEGQRQLALHDEVTGADVIETGADSYIQIALFHNGVSWGMGPKRRRQVNKSLAWAAAKGAGESFLDEKVGPDRTVAAGRQAERSAALTRATAIARNDGIAGDKDLATGKRSERGTDEVSPKVELAGDRASDRERALLKRKHKEVDSRRAGAVPAGGTSKQRDPATQPGEGQSGGAKTDKDPGADKRSTAFAGARALSRQATGGESADPSDPSDKKPEKPAPKGVKPLNFRMLNAVDPKDAPAKPTSKPETQTADAPEDAKAQDEVRADVSEVAIRAQSGKVPREAMKAIERQLKSRLKTASRCEFAPTVVKISLKLDKTGKLLSVSPESGGESVRDCLGQVATTWKLKLKLADKVVIAATLTWSARK